MSTESDIAMHLDAEEGTGTQYLTFLLASEQYGLNILQVREIRGWEQVTRIPNCTRLRQRRHQSARHDRTDARPSPALRPARSPPYSKETVVIVVRSTDKHDDERSLGLVVDAVSDVLVAHAMTRLSVRLNLAPTSQLRIYPASSARTAKW